MVELRGVCFGYPGGGEVLGDVTVGMSAGVTVLVGPNAGGKTTLLRLLAGLLDKKKGEILLSGKRLEAGDLRRLSRMVMQDAELQILGATIEEDIELGREASELAGDFDGIARMLSERLGLFERWEERVEALSYGQKRKLCLIHALLAGPRMLLLDEPFAGLDYPAAKELRDFIRGNRRDGLCQVISTHELEPVYDLADRVVVVSEGRVVCHGEPDEVAPELEKWSVRAPGKGW